MPDLTERDEDFQARFERRDRQLGILIFIAWALQLATLVLVIVHGP